MINEKYDRKQNNNLLQSLCHLCDILRGEDFLFYFQKSNRQETDGWTDGRKDGAAMTLKNQGRVYSNIYRYTFYQYGKC